MHEVLPSRARRMASSVVGSRLLFDVRAKRPAGPRGGARRGTSWSAPRRSHGRGGDRVCLPACESRERGSPREDADAVAWRGRRGAWRVRHDREVRVLAIPLDPAGRIRGDVIASGDSLVLGDRARDLTRPGAWHPTSRARGSCPTRTACRRRHEERRAGEGASCVKIVEMQAKCPAGPRGETRHARSWLAP